MFYLWNMHYNIKIMPEVFIIGLINAIHSIKGIDEGRRSETYPYILGRYQSRLKLIPKALFDQ